MTKDRLQGFTDGVIAILITIMVLDLRVPTGSDVAALEPLAPILLIYVLSFVNLGIYWTNHHHLFQAAKVVDGRVLWANLHLLFWLSLIPFATEWLGETAVAAVPTAAYGVVLLCAAIAYYFLVRALMAADRQDPILAEALGNDAKGRVSVVVYAIAVPVALAAPLVGLALYAIVAAIWFVPDRRIERTLLR